MRNASACCLLFVDGFVLGRGTLSWGPQSLGRQKGQEGSQDGMAYDKALAEIYVFSAAISVAWLTASHPNSEAAASARGRAGRDAWMGWLVHRFGRPAPGVLYPTGRRRGDC
jgi:hypothetical protein